MSSVHEGKSGEHGKAALRTPQDFSRANPREFAQPACAPTILGWAGWESGSPKTRRASQSVGFVGRRTTLCVHSTSSKFPSYISPTLNAAARFERYFRYGRELSCRQLNKGKVVSTAGQPSGRRRTFPARTRATSHNPRARAYTPPSLSGLDRHASVQQVTNLVCRR